MFAVLGHGACMSMMYAGEKMLDQHHIQQWLAKEGAALEVTNTAAGARMILCAHEAMWTDSFPALPGKEGSVTTYSAAAA